jgi:pyruvate kinase
MKAGAIGEIPATIKPLMLSVGDSLVLTADHAPGRGAVLDADGRIAEPARIPCSMPAIFTDLKPGERIWMDDGKIGGVIEGASAAEVLVRIVRAKPGGSKLAPEKGINLPDSNLKIKGLTPEDIGNIALIARHADMVALSFLRTPQDVTELQQQMEKHGARNIGIVLKIETRQALNNLPSILLAAMRSYPVGVMIARGDLAVECGFELLAEAQEEILWLCEASHVPVIWATQVLENLNKEGLPSRAEISDAAMSVRAECVMLNKGPHITETLKMLAGILKSMGERQRKKKTYLKKLAYPTFER